MRETRVRSLGREDPLEKGMATHSSTLAWRIPWTEEPGGLQSMGSQSRTELSDYHTHTQELRSPVMECSQKEALWAIWVGTGRLQEG